MEIDKVIFNTAFEAASGFEREIIKLFKEQLEIQSPRIDQRGFVSLVWTGLGQDLWDKVSLEDIEWRFSKFFRACNVLFIDTSIDINYGDRLISISINTLGNGKVSFGIIDTWTDHGNIHLFKALQKLIMKEGEWSRITKWELTLYLRPDALSDDEEVSLDNIDWTPRDFFKACALLNINVNVSINRYIEKMDSLTSLIGE